MGLTTRSLVLRVCQFRHERLSKQGKFYNIFTLMSSQN